MVILGFISITTISLFTSICYAEPKWKRCQSWYCQSRDFAWILSLLWVVLVIPATQPLLSFHQFTYYFCVPQSSLRTSFSTVESSTCIAALINAGTSPTISFIDLMPPPTAVDTAKMKTMGDMQWLFQYKDSEGTPAESSGVPTTPGNVPQPSLRTPLLAPIKGSTCSTSPIYSPVFRTTWECSRASRCAIFKPTTAANYSSQRNQENWKKNR